MQDQENKILLLPQRAESIVHHVLAGRGKVYVNVHSFDVIVVDDYSNAVALHAAARIGSKLANTVIKMREAFETHAVQVDKTAFALKEFAKQIDLTIIKDDLHRENKQNRFSRKNRFRINKFF